MKYITKNRVALLFLAISAIVSSITFVHAADTGSGLTNPLNDQFSSIPAFIAGALKALVMIALPIISLFIVLSGFYFLTAQGNEGKLEKAKENFFYVIIGGVLILSAWILATLIAGTISQLTK